MPAMAPRSSPSPCPTCTASSTRRSSACRGCSRPTRSWSPSPRSRSPSLHRRVRPSTGRRRRRRVRRGVARRRSRRLARRAARRPGRPGRRRHAAARRVAPVLGAIVPGEGRARRWWALAGAVGVAVGPALGGVLTQLFDWRAIFFVQAPIVAAAPGRGADPAARALRHEGMCTASPAPAGATWSSPTSGSPSCSPPSSRRCSSACCWRSRCGGTARCRAPLLVSALPLGMAVGRLVQAGAGSGRRRRRRALLAVGLVGLALLPGAAPIDGRRRLRRVRRRVRPRPRGARRGRRARRRPGGAGERGVDRRPPRRARARARRDRPGAVVEPRGRHRAGHARRDPDDAHHRAAAVATSCR